MLLYVVCTPLRYALLIRSDLCLHPSNIGLHCPQGLSFTDVQPFCCRCQHLCSVGRCCSDVWICTFLPTSFSYRLRVLAVNCCACMCVLYFTTPWNVRIAFNGFMSGSGILAEIISLENPNWNPSICSKMHSTRCLTGWEWVHWQNWQMPAYRKIISRGRQMSWNKIVQNDQTIVTSNYARIPI